MLLRNPVNRELAVRLSISLARSCRVGLVSKPTVKSQFNKYQVIFKQTKGSTKMNDMTQDQLDLLKAMAKNNRQKRQRPKITRTYQEPAEAGPDAVAMALVFGLSLAVIIIFPFLVIGH